MLGSLQLGQQLIPDLLQRVQLRKTAELLPLRLQRLLAPRQIRRGKAPLCLHEIGAAGFCLLHKGFQTVAALGLQQRVHGLLQGVGGVLALLGDAEETLGNAAPLADAEERAEDLFLVLHPGGEETLKLALGQDHHLAKLLIVQADQLPGLVAHLRGPAVFKQRLKDARCVFPQQALEGAQLQPFAGKAPLKAVDLAFDFQRQTHIGVHPPGALAAAHGLQIVAVVAAAHAVEGKAHGVENAGFPRAGLAGDEEGPVPAQGLKVHPLRPGKGAEGLQLQQHRSHACTLLS